MNVRAVILLLSAIVCAPASVADDAAAEPYLFDVLKKPAYRKSWNTLFTGEKGVDAWLAGYARTKDGPTAPEPAIRLGQASYPAHMVCKAHDCGANRFFVAFAPNGGKAWGILLKSGEAERYFGRPDDDMKKALQAAAFGR